VPPPPEGALIVTLTSADGRVTAVDARLTRPPVDRLLVGQPLATALARVPRLFTVCAAAQAAAAAGAVEAALGHSPDSETRAARARAVAIEAAENHAWYLLVAWPRHLGRPPDIAGLARLRKIARAAAASGERADLGALGEALRQGAAGPEAPWYKRGGAAPSTPGKGLGPLHPFDLRREAIGVLCGQLDAGLLPEADGGTVSTSRGRLTHTVALGADLTPTVWHIDAPTDRHFAPNGPFVQALLGQPLGPDSRDEAEALILAYDPCVSWQLYLTFLPPKAGGMRTSLPFAPLPL